LVSFGDGIKQNMTIGTRPEFKANNNPPPGLYDINEKQTLTRVRSVIFKEN
jgi:hypothetical protein